ncbi:MAG TPA: hypothetical protein VMF67_01610 [Rhizomicrobium sp.]|nr:hypothetical protein [Rhizomicrobium sp.]
MCNILDEGTRFQLAGPQMRAMAKLENESGIRAAGIARVTQATSFIQAKLESGRNCGRVQDNSHSMNRFLQHEVKSTRVDGGLQEDAAPVIMAQ